MKNKWMEARTRFEELDGDKFGAVLYETSAGHYSLEWRIRKADKKWPLYSMMASSANIKYMLPNNH